VQGRSTGTCCDPELKRSPENKEPAHKQVMQGDDGPVCATSFCRFYRFVRFFLSSAAASKLQNKMFSSNNHATGFYVAARKPKDGV